MLSLVAGAVLAGSLALSAGAAPLCFEDATGRKMTIQAPVKRLVALNSDALEALLILKAKNAAVGVFAEITKEPAFFGDCAALPKVGSWRDPDPESIVALKPDAVITYAKTPSPALEEKLAAFGIAVIRLDFYRLHSLEREMTVLGQILGREKEAAAFCAWHHARLSAITKRVSQLSSRPRVYVESYSDFHAAGNNTGGNEMVLAAGGYNIALVFPVPYPRVNPEWVVAQNPDVILKAASWGNGYGQKDAGKFNALRNALARRPAWGGMRAVSSGRVHVMDSEIWVGPRSIVGVAMLARWLHPGLFDDLDPRALHREFMETFLGVPFKGVYFSDGPVVKK